MQTNSQKFENVRTTILSLLLARKGGSTLRQLDNDYCEVEGACIPWKDFGYVSLLNFLQSMSRNIQIERKNNTIILKGIATDKSKHVSKLVAGQKSQTNVVGRKIFKPSHYYPKTSPPKFHIPADILLRIIDLINDHPDGINKDHILQAVQSLMPYANIQMQDMEEQFRELSHKIFLTNHKVYPKNCLKKTNGMSSSNCKTYDEQKQTSPIVTVGGEEDSDDMLDDHDDDEDDFRFTPHSYNESATNIKPTSNFIKETVSKYQNQITESTSNVQCEHNNSHYLHDHNLNNAVQSHIEYNNNATEERRNSLDGKNGEILINDRIKFRLEKLIQNRPNGIWCAELPEVYLEEYKVSLNYTELGFNSVREFASQLPEIFHCVQPHGTGDFMLYYAKMEIPSDKIKETYKTNILAQLHQIYEPREQEALPVTVSLDICKELIPDDTMNIGECVGYLNVLDLTQNEKLYTEVLVVEVFTPSFFWIQLRKNQRTFKKFMNELHNFYVMKGDQYVVPPLVLEKGLNCACTYNGIWHRGIIKTVKPDLQVTVMFYDYGTLKTCPPDAIHYLHRMFSYLPAQAIPCGLVNTRPYKATKWTRSATHHFAMRTQMPLIATIASVNTEDNSMMVTLTDTTEEEDVHINDWLVEQKLAEHGKMGDKVEMSNLLLYVEENLIFSPEKCYENETNIFDESNKESTKKSFDTPLILPQSTLEDTYFKSTQEPMVSEKKEHLPSVDEENIQHETPQNNSVPIDNTDTSTQNCTNPFLQDSFMSNVAGLSPKKFMQLWNENLRLQLQITTTLKMLFSTVLNTSAKNEGENIKKDDNVNTNNTFLHTVNDILSTNCTDINISNTASSNVNTHNENINANIYSNSRQNTNIQNGTISTNKEVTKKLRTPPGYEKYKTKFMFDEDYVSSDMNTDLTTSDNTVLRETNPFKLSLAGKMKISDSEENNNRNDSVSLSSMLYENQKLISDYDSLIQHFVQRSNSNIKTSTQRIPENVCKHELFNSSQPYLNNTANDTNNIKNESFVSNSLPSDYNWNIQVDNVTNAMSGMVINNQSMQHAAQKAKEIENHTGQYLQSFCKPERQECVMQGKENLGLESRLLSLRETQTKKATTNYNLNEPRFSTKIPTNNLGSTSLGTNNTNFDEGYFTRPSTSHTVYTSSPRLQIHNKTECSRQLLNENANKTADMWVQSFQNTVQLKNWNKMAFLPEKSDQTMIYPKNQLNHSMKNSDTRGATESLVNIDCTSTQSSSSKGNQLKNTVKYTSDYVIYFQVFELSTNLVHILHYQGEGWLLTDEFVKTFTKLESTSYAVIFLYTHNIHVQYKQIERTNPLQRFIYVGRILSQTTQERIYNKNNIHLIQLKSAIDILNKLKIISIKDTRNVLASDSVFQDIWLINNAYTYLKYCIENAKYV
ncbi:uncharacterized protein LOC117605114 [Osmia lignaria lignaria]|uniref:uncharacterized protein LOC117605114 n=1 Tax=Osmia lignaria lignaria TaxID=1437193 RepID=UPI00402BBA2C